MKHLQVSELLYMESSEYCMQQAVRWDKRDEARIWVIMWAHWAASSPAPLLFELRCTKLRNFFAIDENALFDFGLGCSIDSSIFLLPVGCAQPLQSWAHLGREAVGNAGKINHLFGLPVLKQVSSPPVV